MAKFICSKCKNEWEEEGVHPSVVIVHMPNCFKCFPDNPTAPRGWCEGKNGERITHVTW